MENWNTCAGVVTLCIFNYYLSIFHNFILQIESDYVGYVLIVLLLGQYPLHVHTNTNLL